MPAITILPAGINHLRAAAAGSEGSIAAMRPSVTPTSATPSRPLAGFDYPSAAQQQIELPVHRQHLTHCRSTQIVSMLTAWHGAQAGRGRMGEGVGQSRAAHWRTIGYLRGKGEFIADIRLAGMRDLAFVRSPVAHARIRGIRKPSGAVFIAEDLTGVQPIIAVSGLPGFKPSAQPVLASDKVRHVGEPIAVCVAATPCRSRRPRRRC